MKEINQGDIYFAYLDPVKGHEQSGNRPVLILQNNSLNRSLNTVVIAPITKNLKASGYLTTYFLNKNVSKLQFDSVILLYQIRTLDKSRLKREVCSLSKEKFNEIKQQLNFVF